MTELERLVSTAGADVVHHLVQNVNHRILLLSGRGKVEEIYELAEMYDIDTVDLTMSSLRSAE